MSEVIQNPITATIPFDEDGVHHGFLNLPHSRDDSAWGAIMIPITVIKNGDGKTALLTGANHGDEYEGAIALQYFSHQLKMEDIKGRVFLIPFLNFPAFRAGTRTSPIDKGNLNRLFPGAPNGTVTQKIADFVQNQLLPEVDFVLDIHAGGKSLDFLPFAAAHIQDNKANEKACFAAMQAFNAPYNVALKELDNQGMFDTAVEDMGKVFVSTELGGGGTTTVQSNAIARQGIRNFLIHAGILKGQMKLKPSIKINMPDENCFIISQNEGLIEPLIDLGQPIFAGQPIARIWPHNQSGLAPIITYAKRPGILICRHFPGLVKMGDCIGVIGVK